MYARLFCLLCLMPYVSPGIRFPAQVQPWAAIMGLVGVVAIAMTARKLPLTRSDLVLVFLSLIFIVFIDVNGQQDLFAFLRKSFVFALSLSVMIYARYIEPKHLKTALIIAIALYAIFAVMQYVAHGLYSSIVPIFVPIQDLYIGERGAASLAPEATDLGFTTAYLALFVGVLTFLPRPLFTRRTGYALIAVCIGCWLLSKSTSGLIAFLAIGAALLASQFRSRPLPTIAIAIAGVAFIAVIAQSESLNHIRGVRLLTGFIADPASLLATSFSHRLIHNFVGVIGFFESYGLGYGGGAFQRVGPEIYADYSFTAMFSLTDYYKMAVLDSLRTVALGVFAQLFLEYGVFGLVFCVILFTNVARSNGTLKLACLALMFLTWFQSFPSAYPLFWLLIGIAQNPAFQAAARTSTRNRLPRRAMPWRGQTQMSGL